MIIRLTLGDSDFTHVLKDFCICEEYYTEKRDGFTLRDNLFKTGDFFADMDYEVVEKRRLFLNPYREWDESEPDYLILINEIHRQWNIFAEDHNLESWMQPIISIQNGLSEKDENGEVCYYFTAISQCLIM